MIIQKEGERGFIKEVAIVVIVILILAHFSIDIQVVAAYIKSVITWIVSLFN